MNNIRPADKRHKSYSLLTADVYDYRVNSDNEKDLDMLDYNSNRSD